MICLQNDITNKNSYVEFVGNCFYLDSSYPIYIDNSIFANNSIFVQLNSVYGGNPCINSINYFSEIFITNSIFKNNKAFDQSNCLKFIGSNININDSYFEGMTYTASNDPYMSNTGTIEISSDHAIIYNVSISKNKARKGAGILFENIQGKTQFIYCELVYF